MVVALSKKLNQNLILVGFILASFILLPCSASALFGGKIKKITADQVELSSQGKVLNTLKLYVTPNAVRMDGMPGAGMNPNMPKQKLSIFTFKDKNEHYIFNHDKKLYFQTSLDQEGMAMDYTKYKDAEQVKELGKEKVSGYKCIKKEVTTTTKVFGISNTSKILIWTSDRFEMPLRTKSSDDFMSEIRNIDKGAPSSKIFQLPKGYKKVDNIMMAMGMDFGSMKKNNEPAPVSRESNKDTQKKPFKMPNINKKGIEKTIQGLGDKLKNFKFGKD
ncbi:MAG: DUF4412 domain-containing protein [Desulfobacula sp.]|nr:DUF4412 domain-containing protein [Desulfobacula sp.]